MATAQINGINYDVKTGNQKPNSPQTAGLFGNKGDGREETNPWLANTPASTGGNPWDSPSSQANGSGHGLRNAGSLDPLPWDFDSTSKVQQNTHPHTSDMSPSAVSKHHGCAGLLRQLASWLPCLLPFL